MNKILYEKIMEAFSAVLPITAIVLIVSVVLVPMPVGTILMFIVGAALLIMGMGFFSLGADMAMMPMGEGIGIQLTKTPNLVLILSISFLMGLIITIAEPDLQVLAKQVPINADMVPIKPSSMVLVLTVGVGVGLFLMLAMVRTLFKIPLGILLVIFYLLTFGVALSPYAPQNFIPVAFDSGGVTTGPITVPFILSMGVGVASIRSDRHSQDDSFGLVSLCSVGPILAVLLLGVFFKPEGAMEPITAPDVATTRDVVRDFVTEIPHYFEEVIMALGALIGFFVVFQGISRRYKRHQIVRIVVGFLYTLIGLVVFLTGVNVGFIPVGHLMGHDLAASPLEKWLLVPLSMIIGYFIVAAEPAVHVLTKQVEEISAGAITQKVMYRGLSIGMALALAVTMVRILLGIPIMYILIPGYALSLGLTFLVPKIFTGIAFDSGGVCSGPMTSTFLLPLAMGACEGAGRDMMTDAFGIVAMVAMAPLIVIQLIGLVYGSKMKTSSKQAEAVYDAVSSADTGVIIEFEEAV
ncbi:MAG: DUF1538 domain-containing protein [Spirochaetaceae bacterium]|jgi:hypothetical protein|nr:DUF1538 domain-containing protein [Spirochaetaceae bacterium]